MDSEVPFTNLLRCNHHWPFCHALTLTRLTLTNLTLIPVIMRILTILFPFPRLLFELVGHFDGQAEGGSCHRPPAAWSGYGRPREPGQGWSCMISLVRVG